MQYTRTSRAAVSHAGWPDVDTPHRQPPASTATAATTTTALLPSHRIDWIESDGNHAPDPGADGLRRVWIALGALTRHHRALATVVMATAMSLPIGLAGAVVLVRGDPRSLNPGVAMIIAATGLWCGTCCLSCLDECRRLLRDSESNE
ncbi:hypothetical protein KZ686_04685 [Cupriavidus cauae]|uniref:hypothetical protein n=1 Tax=Cupriavidus cauae TaxID=2608999 RepID=UPI0022449EC8|nr:hypothetical protein [Cupriavidus cauae]UZN49908.1 hypothetical protein KZ686_04685 [Cupriavidus cauae]